jgi:hypothetical protein
MIKPREPKAGGRQRRRAGIFGGFRRA